MRRSEGVHELLLYEEQFVGDWLERRDGNVLVRCSLLRNLAYLVGWMPLSDHLLFHYHSTRTISSVWVCLRWIHSTTSSLNQTVVFILDLGGLRLLWRKWAWQHFDIPGEAVIMFSVKYQERLLGDCVKLYLYKLNHCIYFDCITNTAWVDVPGLCDYQS